MSNAHSVTPDWLRSSPGEISSPVGDRFGSPILERYLPMNVEGMCERMCNQKDSWVGERDFVRKMSRMSIESVVARRRPCRRFWMACSLAAAVFFAEAFAMVAGKGERRCNRGKPSVILPPTAHEPHPRWFPPTPPPRNPLFLHPHQDRRFEAQTKHADKHAQLRPSLKVRGQVGTPFSRGSCGFVHLGPVAFSIPWRPLDRADSSAYLLLQAVLYHFPWDATQTAAPQHTRLRAHTSPHPGRRSWC